MTNSRQTLLLCCTLTIMLSACGFQARTTEQNVMSSPTSTSQFETNGTDNVRESSCIPSPYSFAYTTRTNDEINHTDFPRTMPPSPWKIDLTLPKLPDNAVVKRSKDWLLSVFPKSNNTYEIWVMRSWTDETFSGSDFKFMNILIYSTETKEWKSAPAQIKDTQAIIGELFMTNDGSIWAHNYEGNFISFFEPPFRVGISQLEQQTSSSAVPIFSKYDEKTNQFEPENNIMLMSRKTDSDWDKVLLDENGVFWIFAQKDGIYSYDPASQSVNRHVDLPGNDMSIKSVALAQDGSIFFSDDFVLVFRFSPKTGKMIRIGGTPLPFDNATSLYFHNIVIDHKGRLWLGDIGWAEPDTYRTWYELIPSPVFITDKVEGLPIHKWEKPWLILESLNGLLWYKSSNGMVWLDPEQEKWCWFTTEQSNIVEDQQKNLWMIADEKLYKYSENP